MSDSVFITGTFYRGEGEVDRVRSDIATRTIRTASERGYPVVVVDGGSSDEFLRSIEGYADVSQETAPGMGNARRQAIRRALTMNPTALVWAEPEKLSFIDSLDIVAQPLLENRADYVAPIRQDTSSYPGLQQQTEAMGNLFWDALTCRRMDMFFGARAWRSEISPYFLAYTGNKQDALHVPVLDLLKDGKRIETIDVDFTYPAEQRAIEEGAGSQEMLAKRIEQLRDLSQLTLDYGRGIGLFNSP